jgi:hypothetical protein
MGVKLTISADYPQAEVLEMLQEALRNQLALTQSRLEQFERECRAFEEEYDMASDEFQRRFEAGELGDDAHWFDWFAAKRGLDTWARKLQVLSEVSW